MPHRLIRKEFPRPPNFPTSILASPETCLKRPSRPSKIGAGPVKPSRASSAANTALREASPSASPFQSESTCARVWPIAMWSLIARLTASVSFAASSFISLPADAHGPLVEGGDAATERVDDVRFDAFDGRGIEILITQRRRIRGQSFRQWSSFGCTHLTRKAVHPERYYSGDNAAAGNLLGVDRFGHGKVSWCHGRDVSTLYWIFGFAEWIGI